MVKPRLLIVDDDALVRNALCRVLRDRYEVDSAASASEAFQFLASGKYAVIISDLRMPFVDGLTLLTWAAVNAPETKRVMLTGHVEEASAVALEAAQLFKIILKPWTHAELIATLEEALLAPVFGQEERA